MKSGNLNFLEPSGLLQTCNGTALPYTKLLGKISVDFDITYELLVKHNKYVRHLRRNGIKMGHRIGK